MAERKVKCQICKVFFPKSEGVKLEKGYVHTGDCFIEQQQKLNYLKQEREDKLRLSYLLAEIYALDSYKDIPRQYWERVEQLRNDHTVHQELGKQYEKGLPFKSLLYTYEYCREKIERVETYKKDFDSFIGLLKYGLAIVQNNLVDAKNHAIREAVKKRNNEIKINNNEELQYMSSTPIQTTKKKDEMDISHLL